MARWNITYVREDAEGTISKYQSSFVRETSPTDGLILDRRDCYHIPEPYQLFYRVVSWTMCAHGCYSVVAHSLSPEEHRAHCAYTRPPQHSIGGHIMK